MCMFKQKFVAKANKKYNKHISADLPVKTYGINVLVAKNQNDIFC